MSPRPFPLALAGLALAVGTARAQTTSRMSVDIAGNQANGFNGYIAVSRDGSFVVFSSDAPNLVPGDTNGALDLFGKDVKTGAISRLSVGPGGVQGNGGSGGTPGISADGGIVAFESGASNLVAGDANGKGDVFVRNTKTGTTILVSVSSGGVQGNDYSTLPAISGDGRYVSFLSYASNLVSGDTNGAPDIFVRDLQANQTTRVSVATGGTQANQGSMYSSLSGDGRYVVFDSDATNLVPADTNGTRDVFVRDTVAGTTSRISVTSGGAQGNSASSLDSNAAISDDGHWIAFESFASNFDVHDTNGTFDIYLRDLFGGVTYWYSSGLMGVPNGPSYRPRISADGLAICWETSATNFVAGDTNGAFDIIVRDGLGYELISQSTGGVQANAGSLLSGISGDGRLVVFDSDATNLVGGDTNGGRDVFLRERFVPVETCNERQSVSAAAVQGDANSIAGYVSGDGRWVGFESDADNLLPGGVDTNGTTDVFLRDRDSHAVHRCSVSSGGIQGDAGSHAPSVSNDGRWVAFASSATNLVPGDTNGVDDVFVHDKATGATVRVSIDSSGNQADGGSYVPPWGTPSISPDGRYVAFPSNATNLVANDFNGVTDVFVHDRDLDGNGVFDEQIPGRIRTVRVSVSSGNPGVEGDGPSGIYGLWISAFGRRVAFQSLASNLVPGDVNFSDIFVRNLQNNTTILVSVDSAEVQAIGDHYLPSISADLTLANDGRWVSFASTSAGLVPGDTNGATDVFLRDVVLGNTTRVSVATGGGQSDTISERSMVDASGRYIVFDSTSGMLDPADPDNTWDVYLRDRIAGTTEVVSQPTNVGDTRQPTVSVGAKVIAFGDTGALVADDTNFFADVYAHACDTDDSMVSFCLPGEAGTRACPCGNPPTGSGRGCNNFGAGPPDSAKLSATGVAALSADTLVFTSAGENNTSTTVLIQAKTAVFGGFVFGAGVRCVSGTLKRLYTGAASAGTFTRPSVADPTSVSLRSAAQGDTIVAGEHRYYFGYYRDPTAAGPCGNATSTFNCTQSGDVAWTP